MPKRKQGEVDNEGVQDFELIELLIRERETAPSTSTQQGNDFESFKARFQSYIDQIPSYLHSVGKEGFFPHFFLGSFSTLIDTEIAKKLDIEKIYFRFDGSKTLKVTVTKKGEIKSSQDAIDKVNLFVIADSGSKNKEFSHGELEEILSQMNAPGKTQYVSNAKSELEVKLVEISKNADNEMTVEIKNTKLDKNDKRLQFTEIKKGKWNKPENDIAKLTNSDKKEVEKSLDKVLKKVSKIHSEYKGSLIYADKAREAAHHGFMAGALVNFRYRHNLRVYLEQLAGRGYADIILVPRGKDRSLNAIPIIIELKAATKEELKELEKGGKIKDGSQTTPAVALKQAEDYTKGFQPNVMRVLTTANDILCVGVNLDYPSAISDIATKSRDQEITPLFNNILESIDKQNNGEITQKQLKTQIQENIERIYHTFPGTGEKGDSHYFSRFLSGQSILLDKALEVQFKKYIFIPNVVTYAKFCNLLLDACDQISKPEISKIVRNLVKEVESVDLGLVDLEIVDIVRKIKEENGKNVETIKNIIKKDIIEKDGVKEKIKEVLKNENIPTEALRPSKQPPRTTAPKKEIDPDPSYAVVTMVFIPEEDSKKLTYVMNIVEADGRAEVVSKGIPLDKLKQEIGNRKIVELNLNFNIKKQKSDFKEYFSMEVGEPISLEQYSNKKTDKFKGNFENVPYPDELKRTFDEALGSQRPSTPGQTLSIDKYNELLKAIGKGTFPLKPLIEKEAHFQAVLHGAFSYYSDIKLGESQENRALVLTEFQTGRGKRIDMVVHGIKFADQASSATEYDPVGLELKGPREGKTADALKDEANKQIADEYTKGVTYKTLTDGKEVDFIGVVFDKGASNADSLILMSKDEFASVKVIHSSIFSISQQQTKKKFNLNRCVKQSSRSKRSVGPCLFSKDDVEKFSKGKVDENNVDKVIIDSEKFLTYVKSSQDEGKNAQLVEFIGNKNIEGDYKYLVDKVIGDQGYERYIQNERIKDLQSDVLQQNSGLTKNPKLKSRLMNAAGGIQLIRGIHGAIVSCKDGTATDCGLNLGGIGWSFASQPIENVMVKIAPKVVTSSEKVVARIVPGTLGRQTKFAVKLAGVKFGSTIAKGVAGAVAGVFDIIDIGISANNLVDCKNRESSDNPCGEKEIRDNIASISFSGVSFVSGVALTAAGMPVVGIAVGFGLMVGYGVYSGVSNIVEYEKKYDTTHGENWSIFWRTILFQDMASDVQHLADRKNTVDSLAKEVWKALNNAPNSVVAYGVGLGKLDGHILRPDYAKIFMDKEDSNTGDLSRVIPDSIPGASRICLPKVTQKDYEKGITSSVQPPLYYCDNAMVISHVSRVKTKQKGDDVINFDQGTMFARGGKGRDMYVIADSIGNKEVKIDNHSDDEKADTLFMPEVEKDFSIQQCDLHLKHNNSNIRESSLPLEVSSSSDIEAQGKFKRTPLHFASEAGEWDKVRLLLDRGANPEVQDKFGYTPIFLATQSGKWSVVELLLNYGANINAQDEEDRTLLCFAVSGNNLDMVQFLLDRGVSIEAQDKFGYTPILYAARSGKWSVVKLFIDNGAKFNNETTFQGTPLHFAIQEGNLDMVQFLLDKGTDIEVQNAYDQKPLHLAVKAGRLDILKLLLDREPNINATDMDGQTPSDLAIQKGYNNIVEILRQAQLNLDKELLIAVRSGDFDKVQDHIIRGADVNAIDIIAGRKPIHITAKRNYKDIVDLLLSKGVSVDQADKSNGMTPLHYAASKGSLEVVKFLIEKGAGVNIKDRYGGTPLHVAAEQGELEVIKYLIEKGAIVNAKDKDGRTPLDIARDKGYNNIVNYLEEELNKEREKPVQRKRRHHHGGHNSHHLSRKPRAIDSSNQPKIATSSGAKPSSWINDLFGCLLMS
ncbi:hypothetical protein LSTR_LSTR015206 [Laodelphax striatellus]|uniref:Uncharacterized protein n=1 Tax=Laodelphax striatellus TaxID=195883 RepID=A0A482XAB8_LAOST|nr:hypothetical protein LSTR_LSTR015206 [Laodelphax striatellus]